MQPELTQRTGPGIVGRMCSAVSPEVAPCEPTQSRTPSLSHSPHSPAAHPGLRSSLRLDVTEESDAGGAEESPGSTGDTKNPGIRYITDSLIKKLTKQKNLAFVRSLNLSLAKSGGKKFKYIENIDKCEQLQVLNLSHNLIEKIEKLEKLHKVQELHLSNNRIRKIEGLEHMGNLQVLNLSHNHIEHVPLWLPRKLRSLRSLNLQHNDISSLHEMVKLKSMKNLTEAVLAENPVSNLPHCRLFLVFHLRALERLDGLPVSQKEREMADQRFHMEEVERLEQELERQLAETEELRQGQAAAVEALKKQEAASRSLQLQSEEQQRSQAELERELGTKNELLKRKTMELTRACQKQYELEQELAFHKIDAKFEPLPYYPDSELELEHVPGESPYIGKARHKRNTCASEDLGSQGQHPAAASDTNTHVEPGVPSSQVYSYAQAQAEERLKQLQKEIENAEQQILRASAELRQLEEAVSQKRISEAEKEQLRQQLHRRLQALGQQRSEAQALEGQLEQQGGEISQAQTELEQLLRRLERLDPSDPQHAHVKAQVSSKKQLLDIMSKRFHELETRLDHMLSRIAAEAEDIKDLEQQLTDGQIAANEALKRDLEDVIAGLQEYLHGVKGQAHHTQTECRQLQREKEALQQRLHEARGHCEQLEIVAMEAESTREEMARLQQEMKALQRENGELRKAQGQISAYEAELEAQLQERDTEAGRLKEELGRLHRLSQMEQAALQAELDKERQAKENVLAQGQLAVEREQENEELQEQIRLLQDQLREARATLLSPQEVNRRIEQLRTSIASGAQGPRSDSDKDTLGRGLGRLRAQLEHEVLAAQADRDEALRRQDWLTQEVASLKEQLQRAKEELRSWRARGAERRDQEADELRRRKEELQEAQELQGHTERRLREAEGERERLVAELADRNHQVQSLEQQLQDVQKSTSASDKMAARQLNMAAKQLRSLQGTVRKISQERAEDAEELEGSRRQVAAAEQELARAEAEIQLLQNLLRHRERQTHEVDHSNEAEHQELDRLQEALSRQQAQTKQLREQLTRARQENSGNVQELMAEIDSLRNTLAHQSSFVSNLEDHRRSGGCWYYVPLPINPPSVGSRGTHDSGLGSQQPPSPDRGRRRACRGHRIRQGPSGGYWVYSPQTYTHSRTRRGRGDQRDSGGESDSGSSMSGCDFVPPPGSAIYTALPDGSPLPPGTVIYGPPVSGVSVCPGTIIYGPPPAGAQLVYGPPPSGLTAPLIQAGILLCNVPAHHDMEKELQALEQQVRELKRQKKGKNRLNSDVQRLQELRDDLEQELQDLRRSISRLQGHREALQGSSLVRELELDQSLQQHGEVLGEVQCVEKTLSRRRAELREADRLLMEAESDLKETRSKTREMAQRHSNAQKRTAELEHELQEMEHRVRDTAGQLVQANHTLRDLQEEVQELQERRAEQEQTLLDVEEVVASRDAEFQELSCKVERSADRLESVLSSLQEAQGREKQHLGSLAELESLLAERRRQLDRLSAEVALQQEEVVCLDRRLGQRREEECLLQESVELRRQSLAEVLRQGEEEAHTLQRHIKELRLDLEALSAEKSKLGTQLAERRAQVSVLSQEGLHEGQNLQGTLAQVDKYKSELRRLLDDIKLQSDELQAAKEQRNVLVEQLEKSQESLVQERTQLEALKEEMQRTREQAQALQKERDLLREQCKNLEARRCHAQRCLATAEKEARAAEAELTGVQAELGKVKQEQRAAHGVMQTVSRETAAAQQLLKEKREELSRLTMQLESTRCELELIGEEVATITKRRDERQAERRGQEDALRAVEATLREGELRAELVKQQLQEMEEQRLRQQASLEHQDERLQALKQEALENEDLQQQKLLKLQGQLQALEGALAEGGEELEQVTASVTAVEERRRRLQEAQEQCAYLQDRVTLMSQKLSERDCELRAQAAECKALREELQCVQECMLGERRSAEGSQTKLRERVEKMGQERAELQSRLNTVEQEAQENHRRARRLQRELNTASRELLIVRDKLHAQQDGQMRQREIRDAMRSLKSDIKAELHTGIQQLKMPSSDTSDTESHKENRPHLGPLKTATYSTKEEQWRGEVLREKLRQDEDHLKAELRRSMWSKEEALSQRRQQTEGSLQGLRTRVDRLDELLLSSSTHSHNEPPVKQGRTEPSESWSHHSDVDCSYNPVDPESSLPEKSLGRSW